MKRALTALGCAVAGYLLGGFGGGVLVSALSSNRHDGSVEAAMTGAFVTGPLAALAAGIAAFVFIAPRTPR